LILQISAVDATSVNLKIAVSIARKGDLPPVGRPNGIVVEAGAFGQPGKVAAVGID